MSKDETTFSTKRPSKLTSSDKRDRLKSNGISTNYKFQMITNQICLSNNGSNFTFVMNENRFVYQGFPTWDTRISKANHELLSMTYFRTKDVRTKIFESLRPQNIIDSYCFTKDSEILLMPP